MDISEVNVTPIKSDDGLVAFASCVINKQFYLGSIGIHRRLDGTGYRLTYPTKMIGTRQVNYYHPITQDAGRAIELAIYDKCEKLFQRSDENHGRHHKTANPNQ